MAGFLDDAAALRKRIKACTKEARRFYRSMAHRIDDSVDETAINFGGLCLAHADRLTGATGKGGQGDAMGDDASPSTLANLRERLDFANATADQATSTLANLRERLDFANATADQFQEWNADLLAERAELRACLQRCADAIETAPPGARRAEEALIDARALLARTEPKS